MSAENKAVVRRFVEEYQSADHDVAVAEELLADDFVDHSPFGPFAADRSGVIALFSMFFEAFPDLHAGDPRAVRRRRQGDHDGRPSAARTRTSSWASPAPAIAIEFDVIDILTVRDGKMREHWNVVDSLALMIGVGAVPPMG